MDRKDAANIVLVLCTQELYALYRLLNSSSRPPLLSLSQQDGNRVLSILSPSNADVGRQAESQQIALVSRCLATRSLLLVSSTPVPSIPLLYP